MLYNVALVSAVSQCEAAIGIHMSPPTSHLIPLFWVVAEHQVELAASHSEFPLDVYFTYGDVCFNAPFSVCLTLSFPVPARLLSMSASTAALQLC